MRTTLARYMTNLEHFATVVEYGSISAAATVLAITQPALTRSIMRLEDVLEVRLLHRTARGVSATECGVALLEHIAATEAELKRALATVQVMKGQSDGRINCGAGSVTLHHLLPAAVSAMRRRHRKVLVHLVEGRTHELLIRLKNGELDVVIGIEQSELVATEFASERLLQEEVGFFVRSEHPTWKDRDQHLADIVTCDRLVVPGIGTNPIGRALEEEMVRLDVRMNPHRVETLSWTAMRHLVLLEDYVALSSALLFSAELQAGKVRMLHGEWSMPRLTTCLFRRRSDVVSPLLQYFTDEVKRAALDWRL